MDERVKLEKDLLKLKARNDFLVSQKEAYERELDEVRQELMLALTLHSSREDRGNSCFLLCKNGFFFHEYSFKVRETSSFLLDTVEKGTFFLCHRDVCDC